MFRLIRNLLEMEVEKRHCARVPIRRLNGPLMPREVVFVEELGSLRCLWDNPVGLTDVLDDDLAHVRAELLSRQLEIFVGVELLFPQSCKFTDLLLPQLHQFFLPLQAIFLLCCLDLRILD